MCAFQSACSITSEAASRKWQEVKASIAQKYNSISRDDVLDVTLALAAVGAIATLFAMLGHFNALDSSKFNWVTGVEIGFMGLAALRTMQYAYRLYCAPDANHKDVRGIVIATVVTLGLLIATLYHTNVLNLDNTSKALTAIGNNWETIWKIAGIGVASVAAYLLARKAYKMGLSKDWRDYVLVILAIALITIVSFAATQANLADVTTRFKDFWKAEWIPVVAAGSTAAVVVALLFAKQRLNRKIRELKKDLSLERGRSRRKNLQTAFNVYRFEKALAIITPLALAIVLLFVQFPTDQSPILGDRLLDMINNHTWATILGATSATILARLIFGKLNQYLNKKNDGYFGAPADVEDNSGMDFLGVQKPVRRSTVTTTSASSAAAVSVGAFGFPRHELDLTKKPSAVIYSTATAAASSTFSAAHAPIATAAAPLTLQPPAIDPSIMRPSVTAGILSMPPPPPIGADVVASPLTMRVAPAFPAPLASSLASLASVDGGNNPPLAASLHSSLIVGGSNLNDGPTVAGLAAPIRSVGSVSDPLPPNPIAVGPNDARPVSVYTSLMQQQN